MAASQRLSSSSFAKSCFARITKRNAKPFPLIVNEKKKKKNAQRIYRFVDTFRRRWRSSQKKVHRELATFLRSDNNKKKKETKRKPRKSRRYLGSLSTRNESTDKQILSRDVEWVGDYVHHSLFVSWFDQSRTCAIPIDRFSHSPLPLSPRRFSLLSPSFFSVFTRRHNGSNRFDTTDRGAWTLPTTEIHGVFGKPAGGGGGGGGGDTRSVRNACRANVGQSAEVISKILNQSGQLPGNRRGTVRRSTDVVDVRFRRRCECRSGYQHVHSRPLPRASKRIHGEVRFARATFESVPSRGLQTGALSSSTALEWFSLRPRRRFLRGTLTKFTLHFRDLLLTDAARLSLSLSLLDYKTNPPPLRTPDDR